MRGLLAVGLPRALAALAHARAFQLTAAVRLVGCLQLQRDVATAACKLRRQQRDAAISGRGAGTGCALQYRMCAKTYPL